MCLNPFPFPATAAASTTSDAALLFSPLPPSHTPPLAPRIASHLHAALSLPRSSPPTADFLFRALPTSIFHPSLSPPSLSATLALSTLRELTSPCTPAVSLHSARHLFAPSHLTPDAILLGYLLALPAPTSTPAAEYPFSPPFVARFAFDPASRTLLVAHRTAATDVLVLQVSVWPWHAPPHEASFAVPLREYAPPQRLPDLALAMDSHVRFRVEGLSFRNGGARRAWGTPRVHDPVYRPLPPLPAVPPPRTHAPVEEARCSSSSFLSDLLRDTAPSPTLAPGLTDEWPPPLPAPTWDLFTGAPAPETRKPPSPWRCAAPPGNIPVALRALRGMLIGTFHAPGVRVDSLHVLTGHYTSMQSGKLTHALRAADEECADSMASTLAQAYALANVSLTAEMLGWHDGGEKQMQVHAVCAEGGMCEDGDFLDGLQGLDTLGGEEEGCVEDAREPCGVGSATATATTLAAVSSDMSEAGTGGKRVQARAIAPGTAAPSAVAQGVNGGRRRVLEERKKRNRLSAARSNFRKKQRMEAVRVEVQANRERIERLRAVRDGLIAQNAALRRCVQGERGGGRALEEESAGGAEGGGV